MLKLMIKELNGEVKSLDVTENLVITPKAGQQFYFNNLDGHKYTMNLQDSEKSVVLNMDLGTTKVKIVFKNIVDLILEENVEDKNILGIIKDEEGLEELNQTVLNNDFKGDDVIKSLKDLLAQSSINPEETNGVIIDDFGSLTSMLDAAAAGGAEGDTSTFRPINFNDADDVNILGGRSRLDTQLDGLDSNIPDRDGTPGDGAGDTEVTITLSATSQITEDDNSITYTANLSTPALTDMTITLSNGAIINIPAGSTTGSVVASITPDPDVYKEEDITIEATVSGTDGGGFDIVNSDTTASTTVIDTIDTTTVSISGNDVNEDADSVTFTIQTSNAPDAGTSATATVVVGGVEHTVTLDANGEGTLTIDTKDSDVYNDASTLTAEVTAINGGNFEDVSVDGASKTINITDTIDETTVSLSATDTNEAAGTVTFTATLSNPVLAGDDPVIVHTELGDITITSGTTGTLEVTNPNTEDVYNDASTLDNSITSVEGGNFEQLTPSTDTVTANIADTIDATKVTLTATDSVEAGEDITYTASVDNTPETDLVITLSNGAEITIEAGKTTGSVTVASSDDVYGQTDGTTENVSITGTTGGNYESLDTSDTATTTVTEPTADETTVSLSATDTNEAAGTVTFTATLSNPVLAGDDPVIVHTELGDITITSGTTGTLEVTNPNTEDVYNDASTLDNSITSVEGGNFEQLTPSTDTVTANIADTIDATKVTLTATDSVEAGEDITYTASVDNTPETDLVITLSNGAEITIEAGKTTGSVTVASSDDVYGQTDGTTENVSITGTTGGNYESLDTSDTATTTVTEPTADETTVSLSATDTNEAAGTVTFTATLSNPVLAGDDPVIVHTELGDITITSGTTGTLEVTNPNTEDVYNDASTLDNSITSVEGGNFEQLTPSTDTVTANIADTIDATKVTLTATDSVEAGEDITYTASVDNTPETDLVITLSNGAEITIEAGKTTGSVTVASSDDVYGQTDGTTENVSITGTTGGNYESLDTSDTATTTVTEPTADETTVSLSATDTNEAAGTVTFTATLSNPVLAGDDPVIVHTELGDITITSGTTGTLEVTNPNTEDVYNDASTLDNSITSVEGGNFEQLTPSTDTVTANIADTIDATKVTLTATDSVEAGEDITYTASVDNTPETDLVITLSNGAEITIEAGKTTGSVTVASSDDVYGQTDGTTENVSITGTTGGNYESLDTSDTATTTVTEPTADETTVSLSATDTNEAAGTVTFTATLSNPVLAGDDPVIVHTELGDITITSGTTGTLEVTNPNTEDVYNDASTLDNSITSVEGGNFEQLTPSTDTVTANIADTIDATKVTLTATDSVEAGEDITYTASVDNTPETDLVITLSNGAEITIEAGKTTGSVTVASSDDVYGQTDGTTENVSITGTTGGNYESLDTSDTATTTVTEPTADETTVSLSATDTNEAAGTVTFTATLSNPVLAGDDPVIVHTELGDITITSGTTGTLEVTNPNTEDVYNDASTLDNSITSVEGGNFEQLTPSTDTVTANIADTIDATKVTLTATDSVEAGEDITYTASVDNTPETDLVITLSNGAEITIEAGKTTGSVTVASSDDVYGQTDGTTENVSITGTTGGNYESLDTSDTATTTVTEPTADETTVSLSATDTNEAAGTVTFTATLSNPVLAGDDPVIVHTELGDITITSGTTGTLEVTNPNTEDVYNDASTLDNSITSVEGGNFEQLTPSTDTVTANIADTIDATKVTLTATDSVEAGEDITYTASVDNTPETDLVITLSNGAEITIEAGKTTGSVTVASSDDVYGQTDGTTENVSITGTTGGNYESLDTSDTATTTVTEPTADETTVSLSATDTNEAAGTVTFTATLSNPVLAGDDPVIVHTELGDITITSGTTGTLEVTNPNTEDVYNDASTLDNSITSVEGGNFEQLTPSTDTVTANIADTIDATKVTLTATDSVEAGEDITYTASVDNTPETDLVITLSNGAEITIEAGKTTGSVTVASSDDVYGQTDGTTENVSITGTTGGNYESLDTSDTATTTVTEPTADETTVSLSATDTNEAAGTVTFTATLSNPVLAGDDPVIVHTELGDITITSGTTGTLEVTNPNTEDVYNDASTLDNSITSVEGGNFEQLTPSTDTVTANIADTITPIDVTVTAVATAPKVIDVDTEFGEATGINVTAYDVYGNEGNLAIVKGTNHDGFGVQGNTSGSGASSELGHGYNGVSEKIVFDFTNDADSLDVAFAWRHNGETAKVTFFNDTEELGYAEVTGGGSSTDATVNYYDVNGNLIKSVQAQGGTDRVDLSYTFEFPDANGEPTAFDKVEFSAPGHDDDYLINEISYTEVIDPEITDINTSEGKVTFNIQVDENYPPQGQAKAIVEVNGQEYEVDLNATGRGALTVDAKDFADLSDINIVVKEIVGGNYEKVNGTDSSFDLSDSFKDDLSSTNDNIVVTEDTTYVLTETDFGELGKDVREFKITQVPENGTLYYKVTSGQTVIDKEGNTYVVTEDTTIEIAENQVISLADIASGKVTFEPDSNSDEDGSFKFEVSDGTKWDDEEYTTSVEVKAVADAPTASINVSNATVIIDNSDFDYDNYVQELKDNSDTYIEGTESHGDYLSADRFNNTDDFIDGKDLSDNMIGYDGDDVFLGQEGDDSIYGGHEGALPSVSDGTDTVIYRGNFDDYKITFITEGSNVRINVIDTRYDASKGWSHPDNQGLDTYEMGDNLYSIEKLVFKDGFYDVIDGELVKEGTKTFEYDVDISAALTDTDGSETLSVKIDGVPGGATLESIDDTYTITKNSDGSYNVEVPSDATSISDNLKLKVPEDSAGDFNLTITARASESNDNEDGTNYKETTNSDAVPFAQDESQVLDFGDTYSKTDENIVIVLDISGSMDDYVQQEDGSWITRLQLAKDALQNMIDTYKEFSNVKINLTSFARTADNLDDSTYVDGEWVSPIDGWYSPEDALKVINKFDAGGGTNYEDALEETYSNYTPPTNGEKATVYFISDGKPSVENNDGWYDEYGIIDSKYLENWKDFLENNAKELNVIGIGKGITDTTYLDKVAQDVGNVKTNVTIIEDENDLKDRLVENVYKKIEGNILDNISGGDGEISVESIVVDGNSYTIDDASNNIVTILTSSGATLDFNFQTGDYSFGGKFNDIKEFTESFVVNTQDEDGDKASVKVNINIENNIDDTASTPRLDFSVEDNGSQVISHDYDYVKHDSDYYGERYTNEAEYIKYNNDVKSTVQTFGGDDVVYVGDDIEHHGTIYLGKGDDFITVEDKVSGYVFGGEGNDSIYLKDYTYSDYCYNKGNIQNHIKDFENIKFKDGHIIGDSNAFNSSPMSTTVYNYTIVLAAVLADKDGSETLSNITIEDLPSSITSIKDSSGNEYTVSNGTVSLPSNEGLQQEYTVVSSTELSNTEINSMKASVTSTESLNGEQKTTETTAKLEVEESSNMIGTDADERFDSHGSNANINAGAGDDEIIYHEGDIIDAGEGEDTLKVLTDEDIDLSNIAPKVDNIEAIDLTNDLANHIIVDEQSIEDLTDDENILKIFGDESGEDSVRLEGNWTKSDGQISDDDGNTFNVYEGTTSGTSNIKILIDEDVSVDPDI